MTNILIVSLALLLAGWGLDESLRNTLVFVAAIIFFVVFTPSGGSVGRRGYIISINIAIIAALIVLLLLTTMALMPLLMPLLLLLLLLLVMSLE